ncbi:unnamed protein product [Echinostoma caproni]|uniref:Cystatin domain-containing protein n=1 Tax=Echinostoma caproni TaxID=27848 RepID=A0A183ANV3_9TREM|nr:unnamed protein product [Echinostoma caproni]
MKSNIVKLLLVTFCVSGVVDVEAQSCEPVVASNEVQSVVVKGGVSGCQYRVSSDTGKAVKVYVNATSGTKCVIVTSGGTSDKLCPSSAYNQLISQESIELSAESGTTTTQAAVTEPSTAETTPKDESGSDEEKPKPGESGDKGKDGEPEAAENQNPDKNEKADPEAPGKKVPGDPNGAPENESPESPQKQAPDPKVQQQNVPGASPLLRSARDTSSIDVTVYYVLEYTCRTLDNIAVQALRMMKNSNE